MELETDICKHSLLIFQRLTTDKVTTLKFKEKASEEPSSYKNLLFWMVRLIHADPMLMLNVRKMFNINLK